jgi:hypothetical protein
MRGDVLAKLDRIDGPIGVAPVRNGDFKHSRIESFQGFATSGNWPAATISRANLIRS